MHRHISIVQRTLVSGWLMLLAWPIVGRGQEATPPIPASTAQPAGEVPPAPENYMGRRIARTMHFLGAEWLT